MKTGILTFAFNTKYDYLLMANSLARRASKFLNLPVTVITDKETVENTAVNMAEFDNVKIVNKPENNSKFREPWFNKNRWNAFELSPYDDTLLLDSDYIINSDRVLGFFTPYTDFSCFKSARYMFSERPNEMLSPLTFSTHWATGIRFMKTLRAEQIFNQIGKIQNNYEYYSQLYGFMPYSYRNDYALTISLRTVNGQIERPQDFFPGILTNIDSSVSVTRLSDTEYKFVKEMTINGVIKKLYIQINNFDFHVLDKNTCLGLLNE